MSIKKLEVDLTLSKKETAIIIDALSRTIHDIETKNYHGNPYGYGDKTTKYNEEVKELYYFIFASAEIGKTLDEIMEFIKNDN